MSACQQSRIQTTDWRIERACRPWHLIHEAEESQWIGRDFADADAGSWSCSGTAPCSRKEFAFHCHLLAFSANEPRYNWGYYLYFSVATGYINILYNCTYQCKSGYSVRRRGVGTNVVRCRVAIGLARRCCGCRCSSCSAGLIGRLLHVSIFKLPLSTCSFHPLTGSIPLHIRSGCIVDQCKFQQCTEHKSLADLKRIWLM